MNKTDKPTCNWERWESGQYETQCGTAFEFTNDGVTENSFKFCPFCGGTITLAADSSSGARLDHDLKQTAIP